MTLKNVFLFVFFLAIFVSLSFSDSCNDLIKIYGNKIKLPSSVSSFFSGETVTVTAYNSTDSMTGNGKIGNYGIESIKCGSNKNSDYTVHISEKALRAVSSSGSSNQVKTFISYMKKGEIQLTGKGWVQKFKLKLAESILSTQN